MDFRGQGLQRIALIAVFLLSTLWLSSCGSSSSSTAATTSGLKFRAFAAQDVSVGPSTAFPAGVAAGIFIINADSDVASPKFINAGTFAWAPDRLFLAPNKKITLAYSSSNNSIAIVNNASESTGGSLALPGPTESVAISPDAAFGYAAVNNASVPAVSPGALEVMDLNAGNIVVTIPIPSARFVAQSHNGNRLLVFGDNSNSATLIATANIPPCTAICGSPSPPPCPMPSSAVSCGIAGFDHPVGAIFSSDDNTAYVLNCGPECGGTSASIQAVDMAAQAPVGSPIPVDAATIALLNGSTLYVAGTPPKAPGNSCGGSTAATTCGRLDVVNLGTRTVTNSQVITDGYHNRIDISQNGQLFVGARNCTNINNPGGEVRGCLSIFNTISPSVVVPPDNGDVTGLQAITNRDVVYVVENGELRVYNTTTNKLGPTQIDLNGQVMDVKLVDF